MQVHQQASSSIAVIMQPFDKRSARIFVNLLLKQNHLALL